MLENNIKKSIRETKQKQERLLIERKLIESRIMMIIESPNNAINFKSLPKVKQQKMICSLLQEINYLDEQGMLNENIMDFMGKIFGNTFGSAVETIVEPLVNSILSALGLGGYFKDFLVSLITTNPLELAKALKSCEALSTLVSKSLAEAIFMKITKDTGLSGGGYAFIRNALGGAVSDDKFAKSLQSGISETICSLFDNMNDKASDVYTKLKSKISDDGGVGGLLGNSNSTTSPSI